VTHKESKFAAVLTLAYLLLAAFAMSGHEMWRDELHSWLVARDAATPWQVVKLRAYDGQPPLWYLLLWPLTRITWHPEAMRVVHLGIAALDVALFARYAPFGRLVRGLFGFGYFTLYEYAAISRCYGLALLFVLLLCIHHPRRYERAITTGVLLSGLSLTTTVGALLAAAYVLAMSVEWALGLREDAEARPRVRDRGRAWIAIAIGSLGGMAAGVSAWPPPDSTVAHVGTAPLMPWDFASTRVVAALLPIPRVDFFFWNSNALLWALPSAGIRFALALALFTVGLFVLWKDRFAAIVFGAGTLLLVGLFSRVYSGSVRHHGFIFVAFLMGAWIARANTALRSRQVALARMLGATLVAHVAGAAVAIAYDTRYVFSSGLRAAHVLQERGLEKALLVAEVDFPATAMIGQLGPAAFAYSPRNGRPFSFVRWTPDRDWDPSDRQAIAFAGALGRERGEDPVLVMNRPLLPELIDGAVVTRIAELYDSMIEEENFYVYRVRRFEAQH
jgi:hypothetical protein